MRNLSREEILVKFENYALPKDKISDDTFGYNNQNYNSNSYLTLINKILHIIESEPKKEIIEYVFSSDEKIFRFISLFKQKPEFFISILSSNLTFENYIKDLEKRVLIFQKHFNFKKGKNQKDPSGQNLFDLFLLEFYLRDFGFLLLIFSSEFNFIKKNLDYLNQVYSKLILIEKFNLNGLGFNSKYFTPDTKGALDFILKLNFSRFHKKNIKNFYGFFSSDKNNIKDNKLTPKKFNFNKNVYIDEIEKLETTFVNILRLLNEFNFKNKKSLESDYISNQNLSINNNPNSINNFKSNQILYNLDNINLILDLLKSSFISFEELKLEDFLEDKNQIYDTIKILRNLNTNFFSFIKDSLSVFKENSYPSKLLIEENFSKQEFYLIAGKKVEDIIYYLAILKKKINKL